MAQDYFAEARSIALQLEREGLVTEARAIVNAIEGGSTGTEILMALRWNLERVDKAASVTDLETRRRIRELQRAIAATLGE